jgi:hypothetical protein
MPMMEIGTSLPLDTSVTRADPHDGRIYEVEAEPVNPLTG